LGFNQSHFYQHSKSTYNRMILDSTSRTFKYLSNTHNLFLRMGTWITSGAVQESSLAVSVDGVATIRLMNWFSSLVFNVVDPVSFKVWQNQDLAPATCPPAPNAPPSAFGLALYGSTSIQDCFGSSPRLFNFEY